MRIHFANLWREDSRSFAKNPTPRIQSKAAELSGRLKHCTKRELEMLIRYYMNGQDEKTMLLHMGVTPEEFRQLRSKLRKSILSERPAQLPRARSATV